MAGNQVGINDRGRAADDSVRELDFDEDNRVPPRSGDPITEDERALLPRRRERSAGLSGAEIPNRGGITDDDLSPETLLDEEEDYEVYNELVPADKDLSVVDAAEIGGGRGKDEAELAREGNPNK